MPKVSVVIPCYNDGQFIDEAVQSVLNQTFQDFEIIIINDGSTDAITNRLLNNYSRPKTRVIATSNNGPAVARNIAIAESKGNYIVPLDADDIIENTYMEQAIAILDSNPKMGIVYCEAELFGERQGKLDLPVYSLETILLDNMIFCTAFFRKSDWEKAGGYNSNMKYGNEDYDFWLSLIELGVEVYRIPQILFKYRIKNKSRTVTFIKDQHVSDMFVQMFYNHQDLYLKNIHVLINSRRQATSELRELQSIMRIEQRLLKCVPKHTVLKKLLFKVYNFFSKGSN